MTRPDLAAPIRFGLIGVDSSHAPSFTRLFGDGINGRVLGGTVTHAWKGEPSPDFPPSRDRIEDLAAEVAALGVTLCDSPADVARECDALLLVASDVRTHPRYFERVVNYGKPIYVDTRFAPTLTEAKAMLSMADSASTLILAGSPKRFTPEFRAAASAGSVRRVTLDGPVPMQPAHPGFSWYGVHLVDLAVAALGPGAVLDGVTVEASAAPPRTARGAHAAASALLASGPAVSATIRWTDGREAELSGGAEWAPPTCGQMVTDSGAVEFLIEAAPPMLAGLLECIVKSVRTGESNVHPAEILDTVALVESLNRSLKTGRPFSLRSSHLPAL